MTKDNSDPIIKSPQAIVGVAGSLLQTSKDLSSKLVNSATDIAAVSSIPKRVIGAMGTVVKAHPVGRLASNMAQSSLMKSTLKSMKGKALEAGAEAGKIQDNISKMTKK